MLSKKIIFITTTLIFLSNCHGYSPDFLKEYPILNNLYITLYATSQEPKLYSSRIGYILTGIADKKSLGRLNSFLQAVHAYQEQNQIPDTREMNLYRDTELLIMSIMCLKQIEILYKDLIYLINNCLAAQEYWKRLKQNPFRKFLIKSRWELSFAQKNDFSIDDILQSLEKQLKKFTHYLGNLYYQWRQFSSLETNEQLSAHIQKTIILIHGCLDRIDQDNLANLASQKQVNEWLVLLPQHWPALTMYRKNVLEQIKPLQPLSFAHHYWFDCLSLTLASATVILYWYNNQNAFQQPYINFLDAGKNFYQSYIQIPLKDLWDILYVRKNERPLASQEDTRKQEKVFETSLQESYLYKMPNLSLKKIAQIAKEKQELREIGDFAQEFAEATSEVKGIAISVNRNGLFITNDQLSKIIRYLGLLAQRSSLGLNDALSVVDDLQLIKALAMNIPAYLFSSLAIKTITSAYKKLTSKKTIYQGINDLLLKVDRILNECNQQTGVMSFETQGILLYWLHSLTNYANRIPTQYRIDFEKDIFEIASPEFETNQKLGTLHRMYRAYPFLQVSAGNQ